MLVRLRQEAAVCNGKGFETGGSSVQWEGPGDIDADHVAPKYCQEL
jgi:hypothetical protein